jgi:hypothetical protein
LIARDYLIEQCHLHANAAVTARAWIPVYPPKAERYRVAKQWAAQAFRLAAGLVGHTSQHLLDGQPG